MPIGSILGRIAKAAPGVVGRIGGSIGKAASKPTTVGGAIAIGAGTAAVERMLSSGDGGGLFGMPLTADPQEVEVLRAPPGYVLVSNPDDPSEKVAVLKQVAYALGLRKRPTRGGITAREVKAARKVQGFLMSLTVNRQPKVKIKKGRR